MPFFLDTQETTERFGKRMAELCSFFDTNHVSHGSPDDLFEFTKTLEHSNQLRIDLSALVKSIFKKEHEELLLTDMMSIIAASVGGTSFADTDADLTGPTNSLMEFLLGTGCWRQFGSPLPPAAKDTASRTSARAAEPRPEPRAARTSAAGESREDRSGERSSLLDASGELRQTLSRLEINTLEVKLHLESIEQRISKIEPSEISPAQSSVPVTSSAPSPAPLPQPPPAQTAAPDVPIPIVPIAQPSIPDASPPQPSPLPEPILRPRTVSQSPPESIPTFGVDLPTRGRAVFFHPPIEPEADDFSSPTFAYAAEKGRSNLLVGVFLVLVAIAVAFFFFAHSRQGKVLLQSGLSHLKDARALFGSAPGSVSNEPTAASLPAPASAPASSAPAPALTSSGAPSEPTPPPSATPAATSSPPVNAAPSQPSSSGEAAANNIPTEARPTPDIHKFQYVQSNVMETYLISAPEPELPRQSGGGSARGTVALQIVVSKTGSVETLHAIKGSEALSNAAIDAVRSWRYRPYIVDGRPVEVATTVYINFP